MDIRAGIFQVLKLGSSPILTLNDTKRSKGKLSLEITSLMMSETRIPSQSLPIEADRHICVVKRIVWGREAKLYLKKRGSDLTSRGRVRSKDNYGAPRALK